MLYKTDSIIHHQGYACIGNGGNSICNILKLMPKCMHLKKVNHFIIIITLFYPFKNAFAG